MVWDEERAVRLQADLQEAGLDALVVRLPENVLFLTGYWPMSGMSWVLLVRGEEPVVLAPVGEEEWVERAVDANNARYYGWGGVNDSPPEVQIGQLLGDLRKSFGLRGKRVGYEGSFETVAPPYLSAEHHVSAIPSMRVLRAVFEGDLADATDSLQLWRSTKTAKEVAALRLANEVAALGLRAFVGAATPGAKEAEVSAAVEAAIYGQGTGYKDVRRCRGWAEVMSGPDEGAVSWYQYLISSDRRLQEGDTVLLELGTVVEGYWSDLTRTVVAGRADERTRDAYSAVLEAQQAAIDVLRPGVTGAQVHAAAYNTLEARGWAQHFPHGTGHGTGFRYHESFPVFVPSYRKSLAEGMVVTIEPGVYQKGFGGIRIEDNVLVTADGPDVLSDFPKALVETNGDTYGGSRARRARDYEGYED
ncbi:MAG TPA: Xaa-Pro peptidase family protein [Chloroflexia bacterium]|nr:Xaa-Pro peptidase family protein [Chloroflexia bacterium]